MSLIELIYRILDNVVWIVNSVGASDYLGIARAIANIVDLILGNLHFLQLWS